MEKRANGSSRLRVRTSASMHREAHGGPIATNPSASPRPLGGVMLQRSASRFFMQVPSTLPHALTPSDKITPTTVRWHRTTASATAKSRGAKR